MESPPDGLNGLDGNGPLISGSILYKNQDDDIDDDDDNDNENDNDKCP